MGKECARDWIRTSTTLRSLDPEPSVSTNFTTRALKKQPILHLAVETGQGINLIHP